MLDDFLLGLKPKGVIRTLREKYPEEGWQAKRAGFGWVYENSRGECAWWCSAMAPRFDGDDDSFVSEFWIYRKGGPPERLW